jgi:small subunit ribosomal protein S17
MENKTTVQPRRLTGVIVSDKPQKTVVVRVERTVVHPKYHKRYVVSNKFHAHDATDQYHTGDKVMIEAMRPMSRLKRWKVIKKL